MNENQNNQLNNQMMQNNNFSNSTNNPNMTAVEAPQQLPENNVAANQVTLGEVSGEVPNQQAVILGEINNTTYAETLGNLTTPEDNTVAPIDNGGQNQFINPVNNYSNTALDGLNVDDNYNYNNVVTTPMAPEDYINDPKVQENLHPEKKNTIKISEELQFFIVLAGILLIFVFLIGPISDFVRSIIYH